MLKSLIWKEWHEQRWKLGFGCVLLMTITFVGLHTRVTPDAGIIGIVIVFGALMLPLLNAMGLVAAERDEGSFHTLMRLPVSPWRIYVIKTLMGVVVLVAPILASALIALWIAGGREMSIVRLLGLFVMSAAVATAVFLWTSVAGMRQPTEARAAVSGVVVLGLWMVVLTLVLITTGDEQHWIVRLSPVGSIFTFDVPDNLPQVALLQLTIMVLLWLWGLRRFARPMKKS